MKNFMMLAVLLSIPNNAYSHEFLAEILTNMYGSSGFVSVASYQLSKAEIIAIDQQEDYVDYYQTRDKQLIAQRRSAEKSCTNDFTIKTCGQFDHFSRARSAAITICYQLQELNPSLYPGGLVPIFYGPSTFVDAGAATASANHHDDYSLEDGLQFDCAYKPLKVKKEDYSLRLSEDSRDSSLIKESK